MRRLRTLAICAWQGIHSRPLESFFTALTFAAVLGASLLAVGIVRTGRRQLRSDLRRLGENIVDVHPRFSLSGLFQQTLTVDDVDMCREAVGGQATGAQLDLAVAESGGERLSVVLVGTDSSWPEVNSSSFVSGGFFQSGDEGSCALDVWVARQLFGRASPVGKEVSVRWAGKEKSVVVEGVVDDPLHLRKRLGGLNVLEGARPLMFRVLEGRNVYVPRRFLGPGKSITLCLVKHPQDMKPEQASDRLKEAFGARSSALGFWARGAWIDSVFEALDVASAFSDAVWGLFLVLAGAMVGTTGLLSVSRRTCEYGIRRTQGATRMSICLQILLEGFMLAVAGGLGGFLAGPYVGRWLCRHLPWDMELQPQDYLLVMGAGVAVILGSFLLPALRASRMEPVEVLREL